VTDLAVDIVIANHNYGAFLGDAIESACAQDHPRVRVMVVDDGSTDDSREVLRAYEGSVETILKDNGGQASAWNAGLARCEGDVVMLLDADDMLEPRAAAMAAAALASDPNAVKVQFRMRVIDADGRPTGETKPAGHYSVPQGDMRRAELSFPFDLSWMATSGNAFRLASLHTVLPVPEADYRIAADWYLVHTSALLGPVVSLAEAGASYRVHGGNNYEPQKPTLDLDHVRQNILLAETTAAHLARIADQLDLDRPERILSVSQTGNRMVSLRLDPERHPVRPDGRIAALGSALTAVRRRFDISWPERLVFVGWFAAMAVMPRRLARRLALRYLFPERRRSFNRLLARLHPAEVRQR
jgi:hypothetical protein